MSCKFGIIDSVYELKGDGDYRMRVSKKGKNKSV